MGRSHTAVRRPLLRLTSDFGPVTRRLVRLIRPIQTPRPTRKSPQPARLGRWPGLPIETALGHARPCMPASTRQVDERCCWSPRRAAEAGPRVSYGEAFQHRTIGASAIPARRFSRMPFRANLVSPPHLNSQEFPMLPTARKLDFTDVPVIDLAPAWSGGAAGRRAVADAIAEARGRVGFLLRQEPWAE